MTPKRDVLEAEQKARIAYAMYEKEHERVTFYEQHTDKQANELVQVTIERDKWLAAFNRSEQFQDGPTKRAEAAESELTALRRALEPVARHEHYRAVGANALFSVEHWKHNAGQEWPHEPDDDSFTAFEHCKHPLCAAVRPDADTAATEHVWRMLTDRVAHRYGIDRRDVDWVCVTRRIGAFDYTENQDGTVSRKDWRCP